MDSKMIFGAMKDSGRWAGNRKDQEEDMENVT